MTLNELEFEIIENGSSNLNLINDFFEIIEEPVPTGRIYKGAKYSREFGLRYDPVSSEIIHEDENYLVGYEPDCERCAKFYRMGYDYCGGHNHAVN